VAEAELVKTQHKIGAIPDSLSLAPDQRVRLKHRTESPLPTEASDPVMSAVQAWESPLGFPPLADATVPGDHVAIAIDADVPQAASIVRGTVDALLHAGVETEAISIVTTDEGMSQRCREEFARSGATEVRYVVHDPNDEQLLCLLGSTHHGPLMVNRTIFDADAVLPIGCARLDDYGAYDGLFPQLSDSETIERYRVPQPLVTEEERNARQRETREAGRLIGAPLVMRIVPGARETAAHVVAGDAHSVAERSRELCRSQWALDAERRASLVIATVTGGAEAQTWDNIARALAAAERLVEQDGAVVICSNLDQPPGQSLGRLIRADDREAAERRILQDHAADSWAAWELARALERGPVYFLSQLDAETVEDMGIAPVANLEELARLASRHESCIVLADSQHAVATVSGE
jgi:nickel-dependent lactate racemase